MKTLLTIAAIAAAFGMAPAAAAQTAPAQQDQAQAPSPAPAVDAVSAASQASPAQPAEVSDPAVANIVGEEPSDASVANSMFSSGAVPNPEVGQPTGHWGFQPQVTETGEYALWFHNAILMPLIIAISVFVLLLMLYVIVRFRRGANPVPSRTAHHTGLEIIWTLVPVLILVAIALPSIKLLAQQYSPPKADVTIKVTGNQWYWTYQYPDHGDFEIVSNMLTDEQAKERGEPRLLAVDERMVVPQGATVKLIVTAADVIHSWGIPAFWVKMDAVPGRLNETWFKTDKAGIYYGQCFELCGARHAYMPIAVEVMPPAQFAQWVASKGGAMPGAQPAATPAAAPVGSPPEATTPGSAPATSPEVPAITPGTATPPVSSQGATVSTGSN